MKRRQLSRLLLVFISMTAMAITISNCGDDSSDEGTGTGSGDWLPMNVGCSWTFKGKYTDSFSNVTTVTQKYEIVGDTTIGDGLTCKKMDLNQTYNVKGTSVDTTWLTFDRQYLYKDSEFYSSGMIQLGGIDWTRVLKLPVAVGDQWRPDESDTLSMAQTLALETVTCDSIGKTFTSCAKVLNERQYEGDTTYVKKYLWFSQGNGIIKMSVEAGTTKFDLDLISYSIK